MESIATVDFANERYIRIYTRDTVTWSLLSFDAQAVLVLLMRKVDRVGILDLPPRVSPARAVAKVLGTTEERVAAALDELVESETIEIDERYLLIPRFAEAQDAAASPAERQRRRRERLRAYSKRADEAAQICEIDVQSRQRADLRVPERNADVIRVTSSASLVPRFCRVPNTRVTPGHEVSPLADLNQTEPSAKPEALAPVGKSPATLDPPIPVERPVAPTPAVAATTVPAGRSEIANTTEAVAVGVVATDTAGPCRSPAWIDRWSNPPPAMLEDHRPMIANAWIADFRVRWEATISELKAQLGRPLRPPLPWASAEKLLGLHVALCEYGSDVVGEVLLAELTAWAHTSPDDAPAHSKATAFLARIFIGGGFSAAHGRWARRQDQWDALVRGKAVN